MQMFCRRTKLFWWICACIALFAAGSMAIAFKPKEISNCWSELENKPKTPFNDYEFGDSLKEVETLLLNSSVNYELKHESETPPAGDRPRFSIASIKINNFRIRGIDGSLKLDFFNDELYSIIYAPTNSSQANSLFGEIASENKNNEDCIDRKGIKFCKMKSADSVLVISMIDLCSFKKINDWIGRWS